MLQRLISWIWGKRSLETREEMENEVILPVHTGHLDIIEPGSTVILPSGKMFYVEHIGLDGHGMGVMYIGHDVEHPKDGRMELVHSFLEKFGWLEIIPRQADFSVMGK